MAQDYSFDITCNFNKQEFQNAIDQTRREISTRFDFKGVFTEIEIFGNEKLILQTESEHKLNALIDIIESKLVKRNLPLSILDKTKSPEASSGGSVRKEIKLVNSLDSEQTKEIAKVIRQEFPKAKPIIQGDSIRVTSRSKDELQTIMHQIKEKKSDLPLDFINFR
jgi:hypothetical protein